MVAFCLAVIAISRRSIRWAALALPLLIANFYHVDSFFLVTPWLIVPLASSPWQNRLWHVASLVMLSVVLGPLLLVKGTLAVPIVVSIGAAALVVSQRSWIEAAILPCATLASLLVAWLANGQHLTDLLYYLWRESYVAGGYINAMSLFGNSNEIWIYLTGAAVLLIGQIFPRRGPVAPTIIGAVILFVAFKAGFVRHDGHAMIAASTLLLLGFLLFLYRGSIGAGAGLLGSLVAWLLIGAHHWPVDPISIWSRMTGAISNNLNAIRIAEGDPDAFRRRFEAAKAKIAAATALPPTNGVVDLYPNSQALLLASNRDYYPRPVMQSYSAYTPERTFLNANHLEGPHAPKTVFFAIEPIDGRYPTLDDGPSWPALLGQYQFRSFAQAYAVLDRVEGASASTIDPIIVSETPRFGDGVLVPQDTPFVWAKMQFNPTLLGRFASIVFKMPLLQMDVTTANGQTTTFRLVPGVANAGFLLSPAVTTAHDFVALRSTATDVLAGQRVSSIRLHEDDGLGLWGQTFTVQFAPLRIPADPAVDGVVLGQLEDGPPVSKLPVSGECTIDMVGGTRATDAPITLTGKTVAVTGWGLGSPASERRDGGNLKLALTLDNGQTVYAGAKRQARPDVDDHFHLTTPSHAGFTAQVNLTAVKAVATLRIVQDGPEGQSACGKTVNIIRPTVLK